MEKIGDNEPIHYYDSMVTTFEGKTMVATFAGNTIVASDVSNTENQPKYPKIHMRGQMIHHSPPAPNNMK
tara:strand:+ start:265 stop:474 length:210 start_codon:yes stop_codon:yes gene_type:complete